MKNILILLFSVICLFSCRGKSEADDGIRYAKDVKSAVSLPKDRQQCIDAIIKYISTDTIAYLTEGIGYAGEPTTQYWLADTLLTIASEGQLKDFAMKHPSAIVRAAVFNALIRKYPHAAVDVAISGLKDMTPLMTMRGCCKDQDTLSMIRVHAIVLNQKYYDISDVDYDRLDSVVLFSNAVKRLDSFGRLYQYIAPKPQYYQRLLSLYDESSYTGPIVALAKYKKVEVKDLMKKLINVENKERNDLENALLAVSIWPDESFKKWVRNVAQRLLDKKENFPSALYMALMAYEGKWVKSMIEASLYDLSAEWNLYEAYEENPRPYYKALFDKHCARYKD